MYMLAAIYAFEVYVLTLYGLGYMLDISFEVWLQWDKSCVIAMYIRS